MVLGGFTLLSQSGNPVFLLFVSAAKVKHAAFFNVYITRLFHTYCVKMKKN